MSALRQYRCLRCDHTECSLGQDSANNWDGTRYTTVTCLRCRHTEFFAAEPDEIPVIFRNISQPGLPAVPQRRGLVV